MERSPRPSSEIPEPSSDDSSEHTLSHEEEAPFEYKILTGHFEPDGKTWKSSEELRMDYLQMTDSLIQKMTKGVRGKNLETGEEEIRIPTVAIFLDKSARPLSHLVRLMWPTFARDPETGEVPPMPDFKFLNIDREKWVNKIDPQGTGIMDVNHLDPTIIRTLRSIYLKKGGKERARVLGLTESADTAETILDNETVMIIDETYSTGNTAKIASDLMKRAFPNTRINAVHWMHQSWQRNGSRYNSVPPWYKDKDVMGRGVNNRYVDFSRHFDEGEMKPEDYYRRMGRWFLSAPHWYAEPHGEKVRDEAFLQLIREFKHLAANPDVPLMPSRTRDDMEDRLVAYNRPDLDLSQLTQAEKDDVIDDVIARKNAINAESAKKSRP